MLVYNIKNIIVMKVHKQSDIGCTRYLTKLILQFKGNVKNKIIIEIIESEFVLINKMLNIQSLELIISVRRTIKYGFNYIYLSNTDIALNYIDKDYISFLKGLNDRLLNLIHD